MPILNVQFNAEEQKDEQGNIVTPPPGIALVMRGPCIQATVTVAQSIAEQLLQQGKPDPISGLALIDTGATSTCVDDAAAQQLQLPVVDVVEIASATHASTQQNVYPIRIALVGTPLTIDAPRADGAALAAQGLLLLIGRDVLSSCTLFYNGSTGQITLSL